MTRRRLAGESMAVGGAAALIALWVLRVWEIDPTAPVLYDWDALLHLGYIENLREGGWYLRSDRLAAPFGQDVRDFPMGGENFHWAVLKVLAMLLPNAPATATAYLFLGYVLIAMVMYAVARLLRLGTGSAVVVALLFSFLPFHQVRWTMHLLRSAYYPVPLAGLSMLWILDWQRELREEPSGRPARWRPLRVAFVVASGVFLGSTDTQNAFYASVVILPLAGLTTLRDRTLRPLLLALAFAMAAGGALMANNLAFLLARAERGPNSEVLVRTPAEQEIYGLRLARLVLPVENHRFGPFADASAAAVRFGPPPAGERGQALGIAGTIGFFAGLAAVGMAVLGRPLLAQAPIPLARLGLLMLTAVLWASVGGFSYLLSLAGLTMYRTWNRMSLWIALFALLAFGSLLQRAIDRLTTRWLMGGIFAAVLAVGLLDQVPATIDSFDPERLSNAWRADAAFYADVEAALPARAMVYQLPPMSFPEPGPIGEIAPLDDFKPYLHTTALRFSYGGIDGRPEGMWAQVLDSLGEPAMVALVALAGFDGALVDHHGYSDGGAHVEAALAGLGATPAVVDAPGERTLWDLRPVRARLGGDSGPASDIGRALFDPLHARFAEHFYGEEHDDAGHRWRWTSASDASIRIDADAPRRAMITATLDHLDPSATAVTVAADGRAVTIPVASGAGELSALIDVPAGGVTLHLNSDGQPLSPPNDTRRLGICVRDLAVIDEVLLRRLCELGVPVTPSCDALAAASRAAL